MCVSSPEFSPELRFLISNYVHNTKISDTPLKPYNDLHPQSFPSWQTATADPHAQNKNPEVIPNPPLSVTPPYPIHQLILLSTPSRGIPKSTLLTTSS